MNWLALSFPAVFGFFYRCRGGFLGLGSTTAARLLYWASPVGLWACSVDYRVAPLCFVMAYLGLLIPHARFQASASLVNALGMAGVAMTRLALILTPLAYFHPIAALLGPVAALSGVGYTIGWLFLNGKAAPFGFATSGSEWGEALTGFAFGLTFASVNFLVG